MDDQSIVEQGRPLFLAQHFLNLGQPDKALTYLAQVNSEEVESPWFWFLRGKAFYDLKRYEDAVAAAKKSLSYAHEAVYALYLLCNCETKLGHLALAEEAILNALRQRPEDPQLLCRYANLVSQGGQLDKAEKLLQKAERSNPTHPAVRHIRITLAYLRGDDKATSRLSREQLAEDPDNIYAHYMLGTASLAQGRVGNAAASLRQAARLDPQGQIVTTSARRVSFWTHWLLFPLRLVHRIGPGPIWIGAIAIIFISRALSLDTFSQVFAIAYLVFVVYSWVMPPLLRWWLKRYHVSFRRLE